MRNTRAKTIDRTEAMSRTVGKPVLIKPRIMGDIQRLDSVVSVNFKYKTLEISAKAQKAVNIDNDTYGVYLFSEEDGGPCLWMLACHEESKDAYKFIKTSGHAKRISNKCLVNLIQERLQLPDEPHIIRLEVGEKDESCGLYPLRLKRHE